MIKSILKKFIPAKVKDSVKKKVAAIFSLQYKRQFCEYKLSIQDSHRASGKRIIVTGGTGAIGSAICFRLAMEGAVVGVCGRSLSKINEIIAHIKESNPNAVVHPVLMDVQDENAIKNAITQFADLTGGVDVLVNNAGGGPRGNAKPLHMQDTDMLDMVLNTNLRGSILCAKYCIPYMLSQKYGRIISMSSVMGMNGMANWTEYASSKQGIIGMTKSLALELGPSGITVNCISPGTVRQIVFDKGFEDTPTTTNALKVAGCTDDVANTVAFLISDEAKYITGQNIAVDGGRTLGLPR